MLARCFLLVMFVVQVVMGAWIPVNDSLKFYTQDSSYLDPNRKYEWRGDSYNGVIHGKGLLLVTINELGNYTEHNSFYGALSDADVKKLDDADYVGDLSNGLRQGFGVTVKDSQVEVCLYENDTIAKSFNEDSTNSNVVGQKPAEQKNVAEAFVSDSARELLLLLEQQYQKYLNDFNASERIYKFTKRNPFVISFEEAFFQDGNGKWISANDGALKFFSRSKRYVEDEDASYEWTGPNFMGVIHGNGLLKRTSGSSVTVENVTAFFGSLTTKDVVSLSKGLYIGNIDDFALDGFGVYMDSLCVYVGDFHNNMPDVQIGDFLKSSWVCKDQWRKDHKMGTFKLSNGSKYTGVLKNKKPDGFGRIVNSYEITEALFTNGVIDGPYSIQRQDESFLSKGSEKKGKDETGIELIFEGDSSFTRNVYENGKLESSEIFTQLNEGLRKKFVINDEGSSEEYVFDGRLGDIYNGPRTKLFSDENLEEDVHFFGSLSTFSQVIIDGPCSIYFVNKDQFYEGYCKDGKIIPLDDVILEESSNKRPEVVAEGIYVDTTYIGDVYDESLLTKIKLEEMEYKLELGGEQTNYHFRGRPSTLMQTSIDETVRCSYLFNCNYSRGFDEDPTSRIDGPIEIVENDKGYLRPIITRGEGSLVASNGVDQLLYVGDFLNGSFDGHGYLTLGDYFEYEGGFKDGKVFGFGKLTAKNFTIPNLKYVDKEIKSISGKWDGFDAISQFFVIETVDGEKIEMVIEPD